MRDKSSSDKRSPSALISSQIPRLPSRENSLSAERQFWEDRRFQRFPSPKQAHLVLTFYQCVDRNGGLLRATYIAGAA